MPFRSSDEHPGPNGTAAPADVDGLGEAEVLGEVDGLGDADVLLGDAGVLAGVGVLGVGAAKA
ncbi:hypothetical protein ACFV0C_31275 [Streptomyces sp. NPDC059568]|uniref:hypothetical protein n=1 Tax=Streptomyces sp. NPDC059568 TaxID=3346868 RepID=UPI0036A1B619